jgi:2-polyprenyl-3-methyl-5-hydroxy-6-metoxy-1,4-benzoquinol methylase
VSLKEPELRTAYDGCPLCGGESKFLRHGMFEPRRRITGHLTWMKCGSCAHVHTEHYFNEAGFAELVSAVQEDGYFGGNLDKQRGTWSEVIQRLIPHVKQPGRWIDVGVGNGSFLFTAAEFGFDAVGIDSRHYVLDELRKFGYHVEHSDAMEYDYSGAAVVVMADLLEHIPYPKALLQRIREKLNGALFISCPNMDSISWRYMETIGGPVYWNEPEHYHNFTRARLQSLLTECGFTPVYFGVSTRYQAGMEMIAV